MTNFLFDFGSISRGSFCELGDRLRPQILNNYVSSLIPKKYIYLLKLNKSNLQLEPKNRKQKCLKKKKWERWPQSKSNKLYPIYMKV